MTLDQNQQCTICGRDFEGDPDLKLGTACPADDCPSRWEEVGREHPDHPMTEYAFDTELTVALRVKASSEDEARRILRETLDCADSNFGAWPDGSPVLGEASLSGEPQLYEINGEEAP